MLTRLTRTDIPVNLVEALAFALGHVALGFIIGFGFGGF